jgi:ATP-dependent helicase/nuclease subunit B
MPVTFVIGRAGSGKTARCFGRTVEAMRADPLGPPILWIVPKQATFMAERELTCASGLGAFCRTRVLSFDQLATEVFAECGGSAVPQVTPLGRQMILGHLLRRLQPRLGFFKSVARQAGLAAELDSTFAELERSGKSSADLSELVAELEAANPADVDGGSLAAKLRDVRLLYDAYQSFLGQERLDPHRRLTQVLDLIGQCPLVRGSTAYVDGFTDFTDNERRTLATLGKACRAMEITLTFDPTSPTFRDPHKLPDDASLFRRTEECYRRLWFTFQHEGVGVTEPVVLRETPRFHAKAISRIERRCFSDSPSQPPPEGAASAGVELLTAPDRATEVEAVARRIRTLTREGFRYRDIAVLVRNLDDYAGAIESTFREHGIPYFVDRRRTAAHHPLLQFVRSVLQIACFDWPHDSAVALLKTGLACLSPDEADDVEDYVLLHRVRGWRWESDELWAYRRDLTRSGGDNADDSRSTPARDRAERVDGLRRRVADHLKPLLQLSRSTTPTTLRQFVQSLADLFEACGVRQTLTGWIHAATEAGDLEQRAEHEQVWGELTALLAQMVDLLGEEPVTAIEFTEVLESGLERFDLALTPPTVDQVLVGQVDRTRTPPGLRAAFVMGLSAGDFPRSPRGATVLSDVERRELRRRKVDLGGDGRLDLLDERFLGYFAFTRASERLVLTRPTSPDGERVADPSPFWERVLGLFPGTAPTEIAPVRDGDLRDAWTPRQLVVSLMDHVRGGTADDDTRAAFAACYDWLASYPASGDGIDRMRKLAWPALSYVNDATLAPDVARRLFPTPLAASAAQLETFAACPFRHFLRYGLGLSEREAQGVTALDLSRVYHHVLERLIGAAIRDGIDLTDPSAPISDESIHDYAHQIGQALRGELMLSSARNEYLLARVEKTLAEVVAAHREMMRRGQFRPSGSGVRFDNDAAGGRALPSLKVTTPSGSALDLRGRIDRIDVLPGGRDAAVFDYRLGSRDLSLQQVYHGLSLQLLSSLLAVADSAESTGKKLMPAAAFYLHVARGIGEVAHPSEALDPSDPRYLLRIKPRGVFDGTYLPALDKDITTGKSDVVQVQVKKEGGFGNRRSSDVAEPGEFKGLLAHVGGKLGELADGVMSGEVDVTPYRLNQQSPCPQCGYKSVCRFDPAINRYRSLQPMSKEDVLDKVAQGEGAAGEA